MITQNNLMEELHNIKNWKKTHKKSYEVYVCRPLAGAECTNKLEGTHYVTDQNKQFIISGTVGEMWVVDIKALAKAYTFKDGTPITTETIQRKSNDNNQMDWELIKTIPGAETMWSFLLPKSIQNFPVTTSWGDVLLANRPGVGHGYGDFLLCSDNGMGQPDLNNMRVINGEVFPRTYDLHAYPNMFSKEITVANTPRPQVKFMKKPMITTAVDMVVKEIVTGLRCLGHKIGRMSNDSIETKSFHVDNGAFGIIVSLGDNGKLLSIMSNVSGDWEEAACWFLDDNSMVDNINRIHRIISGSKKKEDIFERATSEMCDDVGNTYVFGEATLDKNTLAIKKSANKIYKIIDSMKDRLRIDKVTLSGDAENYRISLDRKGANGFGVIDFETPTKAYACFLKDFSEETNGMTVNVSDGESVKRAIKLIYNEFNKNMK